MATLAYLRDSSSLLPVKPHERDRGAYPVALLQAFPKGCMLESLHCLEKPSFWSCSAEGELLERSISDPRKGCNDPAASQGLIHHLTRQVGLVIHQVVDNCKVPGQVKHRPLDSDSLISNLDPFGDSIEGAEGGNSDPLQAKG